MITKKNVSIALIGNKSNNKLIHGLTESFHCKKNSLLSCPHCAEDSKLTPLPNSTWWRVRCNNYHCGATTWAFQSEDEAIAAWNRRGRGADR